MKALGIIGSPRRDGNSARLTEEILESLSDSYETETIFLGDLDIQPCEACHSCAKTNECIIEDDMQAIFSKLKEASVIILSSPVHMGGITSRLRMFMERTWHLRKSQLAGKIGTYAGVGRRDLGVAINEMEEYLTRIKTVKLPGVFGYGVKKGDIEQDEETFANVERLSKQILSM